MLRRSRLLRTADFDRALRSGRRISSDYLALFVSDNGLGRPRVGLAVSRKLGNAVIRNNLLSGNGADGTPIEEWGRPVAVTVARDGGLLISDDSGNRIWKVSASGGVR